MPKTATAPRKATASAGVAKKRKTAAQKFRESPPAERKKRIATFCGEVREFWKGKPSTGSVDFLIKLRRGGFTALPIGAEDEDGKCKTLNQR